MAGNKYYLDSTGKLQYGVQKIDSKLYYFNTEKNDGSMLKLNGLQEVDGNKYYFNDPILAFLTPHSAQFSAF